MQEAVLRARDRRAATASDPRGGEPEAQATGRRPEPKQEDSAGRALKKTLRPAVQRILVREVAREQEARVPAVLRKKPRRRKSVLAS